MCMLRGKSRGIAAQEFAFAQGPAARPKWLHLADNTGDLSADGGATHLMTESERAWPLVRNCSRHAADSMSQRIHAAS